MEYNHYSQHDGRLRLTDEFQTLPNEQDREQNLIHIIWNRTDEHVHIEVDSQKISLPPQNLMATTYLHKLSFVDKISPVTAFSFNRDFYCIKDHDHEVSCNGIIFFGAQGLPIIQLKEADQKSFELLYQVFLEEFENKDNIQGEMLAMLLKRLIIKCTRLVKDQNTQVELPTEQVQLIRDFHLLVDANFKTKKKVNDYADLLFKSPKTLSNVFKKYGDKSPQQIIRERIIQEAKRYLLYTDLSAKEIAYEIGFNDDNQFYRMFKKETGNTATHFRNTQ